MVLEDLVPAIQAEQKPWFIFPITFLYASIAIFLAQWIFPSQAAIVAVFLATLASMPLMISIIGFEKEKEERDKNYLQEVVFSFFGKIAAIKSSSSEKLLPFFIFMFLGFSVAFSFWFVVLPKDTVINLFYLQMNTIKEINTGFSGNISAIGFFFTRILLNNLKVLAFCVLFSIIYGAGAIFILIWNSSVIAVAIGTYIRNDFAALANATGLVKLSSYFSIFSVGMMRYLVHGIPEVLAYFVGGLAGGIISVAVIKHDFNADTLEKIAVDTADLLMAAVVILVIAAFIEVYITPVLF